MHQHVAALRCIFIRMDRNCLSVDLLDISLCKTLLFVLHILSNKMKMLVRILMKLLIKIMLAFLDPTSIHLFIWTNCSMLFHTRSAATIRRQAIPIFRTSVCAACIQISFVTIYGTIFATHFPTLHIIKLF